jgi:hypothetical protein
VQEQWTEARGSMVVVVRQDREEEARQELVQE